MRIINKLCLFVVAALACVALASCGQESKKKGTVESPLILVESWDFSGGFYPVISPETSMNYGSMYWSCNFYDTLVSYDNSGELVGNLAESWTVSDDGLTYTFNLRDNVRFSDGTLLTASAVSESIKASYAMLGSQANSFGAIMGAFDFDNFSVPDDDTFVMTLKAPCYSALNDLTMGPLSIINEKAFADGYANAASYAKTETLGTGPYMLSSYKEDCSTFVLNPYYWGEEPEVKSFCVKTISDNDSKILALRSNEIDAVIGNTRISYEGFAELSNSSSYETKINENSTKTNYLGFNLNKEPFNETAVRQAVAYAVNQQDLEENIFSGIETGAETLFSSSLPFCDVDTKTYETNIEKAKELLELAGWVDSNNDGVREKNGGKLAVEFSYTGSLASLDNAALVIKNELEKVGFEVTLKTSDMISWYTDICNGNYDMAYWYTYGGAYDPASVINNIDPSKSTDPIAWQINSYLSDGLIAELCNTADEKRIQEIYEDILQTISDECLIVPLTYSHDVAVWNTSCIEDYTFYGDPNYLCVANIKLA